MSTDAAPRPHEMVPPCIRSADEFHATVQLGSTPESLVLDFKATIDRRRGVCARQEAKLVIITFTPVGNEAGSPGGWSDS
jgi:hypothetical protein